MQKNGPSGNWGHFDLPLNLDYGVSHTLMVFIPGFCFGAGFESQRATLNHRVSGRLPINDGAFFGRRVLYHDRCPPMTIVFAHFRRENSEPVGRVIRPKKAPAFRSGLSGKSEPLSRI